MKNETEYVEIPTICGACGTVKALTVSREAMNKYLSGALIQNAFPDMDAGDRELLISGICGKCFDNLFDRRLSLQS